MTTYNKNFLKKMLDASMLSINYDKMEKKIPTVMRSTFNIKLILHIILIRQFFGISSEYND